MLRSIATGVICLLAASAHGQSVPVTGATCVSTGTVVVNATIVITGGVVDGGCRTFIPGPWMSFNLDETTAAKSVLFHVHNGATLRNVIIGTAPHSANQAKAIYVFNGATLDNIDIRRVDGETGISVRTAGVVSISRITAVNSADRMINVTGANTRVSISNCIFRTARKVYRQNGGTTYPTVVTIDRCDISGMTDEVFRTDSSSSTARLTNSRLHAVRRVCTGYAANRCFESGNVTY